MEETNVLLNSDEALQPLLQLAQESANSNISMIRTVVMKALSDPKVFCGFDQIKATLQQGALQQGAEGDPILRTLDLFSYGTYHDFHNATAGTYLTLSDAQVLKLRQLTLLTLVQKACSSSNSMGQKGCVVVPYQIMASELGFVTSAIEDGGKTLDQAVLRQVEDIALSCIYAGIVAGKLCQKTSALFVHSRHGPPCRHRDVPLSEVPAMLQTLQLFLKDNLEQTCWKQEQQHQTVQMQLDASRNYLKTVLDRKKKAENSSALGRGAGWAANAAADAVGGPPQERRLSDHNMGGNARRQSKRTRGSVSGGLEPSYRY
jgi:hypothetical protein